MPHTNNAAQNTVLMVFPQGKHRPSYIQYAPCAFMLPVATVPNAIVFGTGRVTIKEMVQGGFVLNLILAVVITLVCYLALA